MINRAVIPVCAAIGLMAGCATAPPQRAADGDALRARVVAALERRGLGVDVLSVIDNLVRHDAPAPPHTPPLVSALLAQPLAAADAAAFFDRSVPAALTRFADALTAPAAPVAGPPLPIGELLEAYLRELAEAQRVLRGAAKTPIDAAPILAELGQRLPSSAQLGSLAPAADAAALARATELFLGATARFVGMLRAAGGRLRFPERPLRFDSAVGVVSIGTPGDDEHGPDAAVIIDPGGNDRYLRAPATGGAVAVIIDLGGDDRYSGSDVAVHGLSAIVDLSGNDRYQMAGPGIGAAIAGASLVADLAGDDVYEAEIFGQGAAALGLGALIDLQGDDLYRLRSGGQGFGMTGGVGLLWDRRGDDRYVVGGIPDPFDRGGGISMAQGSGLGLRPSHGGGIGILRDDAGDDAYEAEMFAQGTGYWYGAGLLWDRSGNDRYRAVRYAQGSGVHLTVGVLRDESGDDRYELSFGVGQGMGHDVAVGILFDGAGDDEYLAPLLAQGSALANGLGLLLDADGAGRWRMNDTSGWGRAEWARGLPSVGLLLYQPRRAAFELAGKPQSYPPEAAAFGGPGGRGPVEHEPGPAPRAPVKAPAENDPRCGPRANALAADLAEATDAAARAGLARIAQAALHSTCWRLQAQALVVLKRLGVAPDPAATLPSFLRHD
jgi:hypothetical protein